MLLCFALWIHYLVGPTYRFVDFDPLWVAWNAFDTGNQVGNTPALDCKDFYCLILVSLPPLRFRSNFKLNLEHSESCLMLPPDWAQVDLHLFRLEMFVRCKCSQVIRLWIWEYYSRRLSCSRQRRSSQSKLVSIFRNQSIRTRLLCGIKWKCQLKKALMASWLAWIFICSIMNPCL